MCRWITLISSNSISLSDVVLAPSNALIRQSRDASFHPGYGEMNNAALNADGFGVGWYHSNIAIISATHQAKSADGTVDAKQMTSPVINTSITLPDPKDYRAAAVFRDVFPAWNNMNLRELCMSTSSNCIMAHVRAASPGTGVNHNNCHPFKAGRLLFCHNGRVYSYQKVKRRFLAELSDEAFLHVRGTTDSECVFGLILTHLAKDGFGSPLTQTTPFGSKRLIKALKHTLSQIGRILEQAGIMDGYSTSNFSLTDGETMVVTRYCDRAPGIPPPSLYFAFGDAQSLYHELTNEFAEKSSVDLEAEEKKEASSSDEEVGGFVDSDGDFEEREIILTHHESRPGTIMEEVNPSTATFIVSSDPLTRTHRWYKLPRNSIMWCTRGKHPQLRLIKHHSINPEEPMKA